MAKTRVPFKLTDENGKPLKPYFNAGYFQIKEKKTEPPKEQALADEKNDERSFCNTL